MATSFPAGTNIVLCREIAYPCSRDIRHLGDKTAFTARVASPDRHRRQPHRAAARFIQDGGFMR